MTDKEKIRRLRHEAVSELIRRLELDRLEGVRWRKSFWPRPCAILPFA